MKYDNHPDPQGIPDPQTQNANLLKESSKQDAAVLQQFETSLKRQLQKQNHERWVHGVSLLDKIKSVVGVIFHSLGALIYEGVDDCFETFSKHITSVFQTTFLAEQHNDFNYILVALHLVNQLSIQQFENHKWTKQIKSKQALVVTSLLLNDANLHLARSLCKTDGVQTDEWYSLKRQILVEQIEKKLQSSPGSDTVFYNNCLKNLGQHDAIMSFYPKKCERTDAMRCCIPKVKKVFLWDSINVKVEADGNIYDRGKDPPGQRSVYIPPGDSYQESYRLSTFLRFSDQIPVNPRQLASAGFLYTGYKDRVKCFSCGLCVEDWAVGDDVKSTRWHRSDCEYIRGTESGNVPIGGGGLARFLTTPASMPNVGSPRHPTEARDVRSWPGSTNNQASSSNHTPANPPPSYRHHQTARPVHQSSSINTVEFATIASAYHENFVKNLDLRKESERLRTYEHFPTSSPTVTTHDLARSGFFYLGNLDRVQCFSCGGVLRNWNYGDSVQSEHRRHFPTCNMVQGSETRNIPLTSDERAANTPQQPIFTEPPDPPQSEQRDLESMFPCEYPVSPHMRNEDSRFQTFDERWSANNVQATPQQISKAGFFYLGERDRVKCWYCNGGLQNWDPQDEPWTEHAKWFPTCEFLLRRKGPDFVHRMVSMFPNLPRPLLRGPFDVPPTQRSTRIQFGTNSARAPTPPPEIIDPQAELRQEEERVDHAMTSEIVRAALDLGFSTRLVRKVVRRRIRRTEMYTSVADLIDDVTLEEREHGSDDEEEMTSSSAVASTSQAMEAETSEETSPSMLQRIHEIQDERKCKLCHIEEADNVLVPCGHLCICTSCTSKTSKCPLCRRKFDKAIRTYIT